MVGKTTEYYEIFWETKVSVVHEGASTPSTHFVGHAALADESQDGNLRGLPTPTTVPSVILDEFDKR